MRTFVLMFNIVLHSRKEKGLTPPSTDHQNSGNSEAKGAEAIYNRVRAAKKVPLDRMPYNLQHTVEVKNGSLIMPHKDLRQTTQI